MSGSSCQKGYNPVSAMATPTSSHTPPDESSRSRPFGVLNEEALPPATDTEWVIRRAFEASTRYGYELLFRRYYRPLCSHAVRFVYAKEAAQDIVSEVFLNFWKNRVHEHITTSYRAYLFTSVRNRVFNYLQDEFRRGDLLGARTDQPDDVFTDEDPQQILQYTDLFNRLEEEIRALPPQCQRVFVLSRFEGRKHREIAEELQISLKTVEAHMLRALSHLRKALLLGLGVLLTFMLGR